MNIHHFIYINSLKYIHKLYTLRILLTAAHSCISKKNLCRLAGAKIPMVHRK